MVYCDPGDRLIEPPDHFKEGSNTTWHWPGFFNRPHILNFGLRRSRKPHEGATYGKSDNAEN